MAKTSLTFTQARRLAAEHMPRMPDESPARHAMRLDLQAAKLLTISARHCAGPADAAGFPVDRWVIGEGC